MNEGINEKNMFNEILHTKDIKYQTDSNDRDDIRQKVSVKLR